MLASWADRFRYILVDEYQDSNVAQYLWLRLLAQGRNNICCVGDDDQSIYSWRGAEVGNILRFDQEFPGARVVRLEQNYRSTQPLLDAASQVISRNRKRLGKTLWTDARDGHPVAVRSFQSGEAEAAFVGKRILKLQRRGESLDEVAILVRASFLMREFEDRLLDIAVPYRVVGGPRFYERREVRDAVAYLRAVAQPADDLALERIVNVPRRGIGEATLATLRAFARDRSAPMQKAARLLIEAGGAPARARAALGELIAQLDRWRAMKIPPEELAEVVLEESGYAAMWKSDPGIDAPGRIENLEELVSADLRVPIAARVPRTCQPRDGPRRARRSRDGEPYDAPCGQGAGVRARVSSGVGRKRLSQSPLPRRTKGRGAGRGAPAGLCRDHPRQAPGMGFVRCESAHTQQLGSRSGIGGSSANWIRRTRKKRKKEARRGRRNGIMSAPAGDPDIGA